MSSNSGKPPVHPVLPGSAASLHVVAELPVGIMLVKLASAVIFDLLARFQWEKSVPIGGVRSVDSTSA